MGKTTRTFPSLPCAVGIVRLARTSVTEEEAEVPRTVINRPTVLAHIRRGLRQVGGNVELAAPLVVLRQRQARQEDTATRLVTGVREDELAILNIRQLGLIDCDDRPVGRDDARDGRSPLVRPGCRVIDLRHRLMRETVIQQIDALDRIGLAILQRKRAFRSVSEFVQKRIVATFAIKHTLAAEARQLLRGRRLGELDGTFSRHGVHQPVGEHKCLTRRDVDRTREGGRESIFRPRCRENLAFAFNRVGSIFRVRRQPYPRAATDFQRARKAVESVQHFRARNQCGL